jgi:exopolyphosphatase/guanosine-5'-triphosphate,3'-diphosphate pyrophosphatase
METDKELYAAIDLGSNSFHMIVAEIIDDQLQIIDSHKDMVRLADGLNHKDKLTAEKMRFALDSLERMAQRITIIPKSHLRIVGTNTLRKAKNAKKFINKAKKVLGKPIEIISGREEARILYLGVSHCMPNEQGKRLVIDIGGGSTELIIGEEFSSILRESINMGCVSHTQKFFKSGEIKRENWDKAVLNARRQLVDIITVYENTGWDYSIGASGTMRAASEVLFANDFCDHGINASGLDLLIEKCLEIGLIENLIQLPGLSIERAPVFIGGLAIIKALFVSLKIKQMDISTGALREGIVYDLSGRLHHNDIRERTINKLTNQFEIDPSQSQRVKLTCENLLLNSNIKLNHSQELLLSWAIRLHELGIAISHSKSQDHAAYIITYADMPGFSRPEQLKLAVLIALQKRKIKKDWLNKLSEKQIQKLKPLIILLRLSIIFNRTRIIENLDISHLQLIDNNLTLELSNTWLDLHPLTKADLESEQKYLSLVNIEFLVNS